jgi:hypothetical protein
MGCLLAVVLCAATASAATKPISDEAFRLAALRAIFPGMRISVEQGKKIDDRRPKEPRPDEVAWPDALADGTVYSVIGRR